MHREILHSQPQKCLILTGLASLPIKHGSPTFSRQGAIPIIVSWFAGRTWKNISEWCIWLSELLWNVCSVCVICANVAANCVLLETHGRRGYKWQEKEFTVNHLSSRKGTCNMKWTGHETWKILMNDLQNLSKFKTVHVSCVRRIRPTCTLCTTRWVNTYAQDPVSHQYEDMPLKEHA